MIEHASRHTKFDAGMGKLPVGWVFANISNDQLCCIGQRANVRLLN